jgi:hypothetical protein
MESQHGIGDWEGIGRRYFRPATKSGLGGCLSEAQLVRLEQYEALGPAKPDPFQKMATLILSDLIRDALGMAGKAQQSVADITAEKQFDDAPMVRSYLSVTRRIAMYAQLELRIGLVTR